MFVPRIQPVGFDCKQAIPRSDRVARFDRWVSTKSSRLTRRRLNQSQAVSLDIPEEIRGFTRAERGEQCSVERRQLSDQGERVERPAPTIKGFGKIKATKNKQS
jgi:hypothetical protein